MTMLGPEIFVRTLSESAPTGKSRTFWQYHSRSDRHSKAGCWGVMLDLMNTCELLRKHVELEKVGFGINHQMQDFQTGRKKNLDLVICTPGPASSIHDRSFLDLATDWKVAISNDDRRHAEQLPELRQRSVGSVLMALEAKACMTAHTKARPRLFDELNSSHQAIHGSSDQAIAVGFTVVNISEKFISSGRNKSPRVSRSTKWSRHRQPGDASGVIAKISEIQRRSKPGDTGFDAIGIMVVNCVNDGSEVTIHHEEPAPATSDIRHYDQMIRRVSHIYATRFKDL